MLFYFVAASLTSVGAVAAASETSVPLWLLAVIGLAGPAVALYGYLKTKAKVKEVHFLVNSHLSRTFDRLAVALLENVRLKETHNIPVSDFERREAANPSEVGNE